MKLRFFIITIICWPFCIQADDFYKQEKLIQYSQLSGLYEEFRLAKEETINNYSKLPDEMLQNFLINHPDVTEITKQKVLAAYNNYLSAINNGMTVQEMVDIWMHYFSMQISETDLDNLIAFYSTPTGRRYVNVIKIVNKDYLREFDKINMKVISTEMKALNDNINKIVSQDENYKDFSFSDFFLELFR